MTDAPSGPPRGRLRAILLAPVALAVVSALAAVGLAGGFFSAWGIAKTTERARSADGAAVSDSASETPAEIPPFYNWPEQKPDLILVVSAETLGYMRPCGCSEGQTGGLARRAGLVDFLLNEKQWPPLLLDAGNLVKGEGLLPWDKARYHYIVESLKSLGYRVLGVGRRDLSIPDQTPVPVGEALNSDPPLTMILGNVESDDEQFQLVAGEYMPDCKVVEESGVKVGVGCVLGEGAAESLSKLHMRVSPPAEAARAAHAKMAESGAELKVLFAHMPKEDAVQLAKDAPGFDLVVCDSGGAAAIPDDAEWVGATMVAFIGPKGMALGAIGYWREGEPKLKFDVIQMTDRFREKDEVNDLYAQYVAQVEDEEYAKKLNRLPAPHGDEYIGSDRCGACHRRTYEHWKGTKHAVALHTLEVAKPDGQDYNPECLACHVVGWKMDHSLGKPVAFQSGFVSADQTAHLGNVGCENCHGPGLKHASDPMDPAGRARMRVTRNERECRQCHDLDNSLHFEFESYWKKVAHPWRD